MVRDCGPLPSLKGSDVWALGLYRVCKGYIRGPLLVPILKDHVNTLRLQPTNT